MRESFEKNKKGIMLMIISSFCACIGQLLWKMSATDGIIYMLIGFLFYGVGALLMIFAYRYGKVSVLQPILGLNYALSIIFAIFILKETITIYKVIGVFCVIMGVTLIAGGDEE